jgi:hypothetical protein
MSTPTTVRLDDDERRYLETFGYSLTEYVRENLRSDMQSDYQGACHVCGAEVWDEDNWIRGGSQAGQELAIPEDTDVVLCQDHLDFLVEEMTQ